MSVGVQKLLISFHVKNKGSISCPSESGRRPIAVGTDHPRERSPSRHWANVTHLPHCHPWPCPSSSAHCWCFPLQVFRTDLITAMKIPDSFQLSPEEYYVLADPWRQEWEKGVQVPASAEAIPEPVVR